jgi:hypothetical protein
MNHKNPQRRPYRMNPIVSERALAAFTRYANIEIGLSRMNPTVSETDKKYAHIVNRRTLFDDSR